MIVKEVMEKYNNKVPFPITPRKIRAAGYNIHDYLINLKDELSICTDSNKKAAQDIIKRIIDLENLFI